MLLRVNLNILQLLIVSVGLSWAKFLVLLSVNVSQDVQVYLVNNRIPLDNNLTSYQSFSKKWTSVNVGPTTYTFFPNMRKAGFADVVLVLTDPSLVHRKEAMFLGSSGWSSDSSLIALFRHHLLGLYPRGRLPLKSFHKLSDCSAAVSSFGSNDLILVDLDGAIYHEFQDAAQPLFLYDPKLPQVVDEWKERGVMVIGITSKKITFAEQVVHKLHDAGIHFSEKLKPYAKLISGKLWLIPGILFVDFVKWNGFYNWLRGLEVKLGKIAYVSGSSEELKQFPPLSLHYDSVASYLGELKLFWSLSKITLLRSIQRYEGGEGKNNSLRLLYLNDNMADTYMKEYGGFNIHGAFSLLPLERYNRLSTAEETSSPFAFKMPSVGIQIASAIILHYQMLETFIDSLTELNDHLEMIEIIMSTLNCVEWNESIQTDHLNDEVFFLVRLKCKIEKISIKISYLNKFVQ